MFDLSDDGSSPRHWTGGFRRVFLASPIRLEDRERIASQVLRLLRWPLVIALVLSQLAVVATMKLAQPTRLIPACVVMLGLLLAGPVARRRGALAAFKVVALCAVATTTLATILHGVETPGSIANILILAAVVPLYGMSAGLLLVFWVASCGGAWFILRHFGWVPEFAHPSNALFYLLMCGYMLCGVGLFSIPSYLLTAALQLSEQRRQELLRVERDLANARQLESLGQLAGGVAHDFNNMLMALQGALQSLTDERATEQERSEAVNTMDQAIRRATEVTRKLLAFGRRDRFETHTIDLNQLVTGASVLLRRTLGAPVELVLDLEPEAMLVEGDEAAIEHALLNLVVNARDAMREGGRLTIRTRHESLDDAACAALPFAPRPGDYVRLSVEDTGIGMDEQVKAHAFEPFFTTKAVGEGTGLGLAAVHGTMLSHSGGVVVESRANQGTCIRLYFPRAHGHLNSVKPQSMTRELARFSGTVLIVDDEPLMLRVGRRHLTQLGLDVVAVGDGSSALSLLAAGTHFDCIITDFVMPKMSGTALIDKIRESNIDIPIIVMTGYPSGSNADRNGTLSEYPCLRKPFSREELAKVLGRVLQTRHPRDASQGTAGLQ